ncbi:MAG: hypothetical protein JSS34_03275 [Proteobacteria bacterium]|nr:hypothetical protein [Pseudomonadota bacterium]
MNYFTNVTKKIISIFLIITFSFQNLAVAMDSEFDDTQDKKTHKATILPINHSLEDLRLLNNETIESPEGRKFNDHKISINEVTESELLLTNRNAYKTVLKSSIPLIISMAPVISKSIVNNIILAQLEDPDAIAAGPLISTYMNSVTGSIGAILSCCGILGGKRAAMEDHEGLRDVVRNGYFAGLILTIPSLAIYLNAGRILKSTGVENSIADNVQDYFFYYSIGSVLPTYWTLVDQQLALSLNKNNLPIVISISRTAISLLASYPLALGAWGCPKLGVAGLGYGTSIGTLSAFLAIRTYISYSEAYTKYPLLSNFSFSTYTNNMRKFITKGGPLGLLRFMEWGNLAANSMILGTLNRNTQIAEQISIQPIIAYNFILIALTQASGIIISQKLGQAEKLKAQDRQEEYKIALNNAKRLGSAAIAISFFSSLATAGLFIGLSHPLQRLFEGTPQDIESKDDWDTIQSLADTMLLVNSISLLADGPRNVGGGAFSGYEEVIFAPSVSFAFMSVLALPISAGLVLGAEFNPVWAYGMRAGGIFLSALTICYKWYQKKSVPEKKAHATIENVGLISNSPSRRTYERAWYNPIRWGVAILSMFRK